MWWWFGLGGGSGGRGLWIDFGGVLEEEMLRFVVELVMGLRGLLFRGFGWIGRW